MSQILIVVQIYTYGFQKSANGNEWRVVNENFLLHVHLNANTSFVNFTLSIHLLFSQNVVGILAFSHFICILIHKSIFLWIVSIANLHINSSSH